MFTPVFGSLSTSKGYRCVTTKSRFNSGLEPKGMRGRPKGGKSPHQGWM